MVSRACPCRGVFYILGGGDAKVVGRQKSVVRSLIQKRTASKGGPYNGKCLWNGSVVHLGSIELGCGVRLGVCKAVRSVAEFFGIQGG
jgi:hypothetical protein